MMNSRKIAIVATSAIAGILVLLLLLCKMSFDSSALPQPPRPMTDLVEAEEEYVEFFELPLRGNNDPTRAYASEESDGVRDLANIAGSDMRDAGLPAHTPPHTTSSHPSPVRERPQTQQPAGPTREESEREAALRAARQGITDAFSNNGNAAAAGNTTTGSAGSPDGTGSDVNGSGSGTVGGGWLMPHYRKVPSTLTGSIELRAIVDASGTVTSVEQIGGEAPAAANSALVRACMAEVRAHRFTRNDDTPPPRSIATITYRFR